MTVRTLIGGGAIYFALRDYGTATWEGGDAGCDHVAGNARNDVTPERLAERAALYGTGQGAGSNVSAMQFRATCGKCGARRIDAQLGLEPTPEAYLQTMVEVFREVRRVLRPDGTCWVNMGDSYSTGGSDKNFRNSPNANRDGTADTKAPRCVLSGADGAKAKDLLMMPARLALALQADGWWLRSAITWCKPSPMPESVTDRPTSATEMIYLLTKRATYFYDSVAIREPSVSDHPSGNGYKRDARLSYADSNGARGNEQQWNGIGGTRNARNWWVINSQPFADAHFATFPPALVERCIRAGTSERGCCSACGKPWVRQTSVNYTNAGNGNNNMARKGGDFGEAMASRPYEVRKLKDTTTTGWAAGCACGELRCVKCSFVLDTSYANTKRTMPSVRQTSRAMGEHQAEEVLRLEVLSGVDAPEGREASGQEDVPRMRDTIPSVAEVGEVLQPAVLRGAAKHAGEDQLQAMREGNPTDQHKAEVLQLGMFGQMDGTQSQHGQGMVDHQQGIQADPTAGTSERDALWLCDGTSAGDGEEAGQASDQRRGGSPQERQQAGQSHQQPRTDGEAPARRAPKAGLSCDVPELSAHIPDTGTCPHCGSHAEWTTPNTVPCVVLDCFSGAGTTGLVADRLQRDAIMIELNPSYTAMADARIVDDCPLFSSWPPADDPADERMADLFAPLAAD